jgi:hypothetical protein
VSGVWGCVGTKFRVRLRTCSGTVDLGDGDVGVVGRAADLCLVVARMSLANVSSVVTLALYSSRARAAQDSTGSRAVRNSLTETGRSQRSATINREQTVMRRVNPMRSRVNQSERDSVSSKGPVSATL